MTAGDDVELGPTSPFDEFVRKPLGMQTLKRLISTQT